MLLAGLDQREEANGAPRPDSRCWVACRFIGDLLVGQTNNAANRTELVVFIRPVVVHDGQDAQTVAEEFRSRLRTSGIEQPLVPPKPPLVLKR